MPLRFAARSAARVGFRRLRRPAIQDDPGVCATVGSRERISARAGLPVVDQPHFGLQRGVARGAQAPRHRAPPYGDLSRRGLGAAGRVLLFSYVHLGCGPDSFPQLVSRPSGGAAQSGHDVGAPRHEQHDAAARTRHCVGAAPAGSAGADIRRRDHGLWHAGRPGRRLCGRPRLPRPSALRTRRHLSRQALRNRHRRVRRRGGGRRVRSAQSAAQAGAGRATSCATATCACS